MQSEHVKVSKWPSGMAVIMLTADQAKAAAHVDHGHALKNKRLKVEEHDGFLRISAASDDERGMVLFKRDDMEAPWHYMVTIPAAVSKEWKPFKMVKVSARINAGALYVPMPFMNRLSDAVSTMPAESSRSLMIVPPKDTTEVDIDELQRAVNVVNRYATMAQTRLRVSPEGLLEIDLVVKIA